MTGIVNIRGELVAAEVAGSDVGLKTFVTRSRRRVLEYPIPAPAAAPPAQTYTMSDIVGAESLSDAMGNAPLFTHLWKGNEPEATGSTDLIGSIDLTHQLVVGEPNIPSHGVSSTLLGTDVVRFADNTTEELGAAATDTVNVTSQSFACVLVIENPTTSIDGAVAGKRGHGSFEDKDGWEIRIIDGIPGGFKFERKVDNQNADSIVVNDNTVVGDGLGHVVACMYSATDDKMVLWDYDSEGNSFIDVLSGTTGGDIGNTTTRFSIGDNRSSFATQPKSAGFDFGMCAILTGSDAESINSTNIETLANNIFSLS